MTNINIDFNEVPLLIAAWAADDRYDYNNNPNYFSATTLIKNAKQIIMTNRAREEGVKVDILDFINSSLGTAIHDSIEKTWKHNKEQALSRLGLTKEQIDSIIVNPDKPITDPSKTVMYIERRATKTLNVDGQDWIIGGKFDYVVNGELFDIKTTSTYTYVNDSNAENYIMQGSIYKYLHDDVVTGNVIHINYIFKDWQAGKVGTTPNYPKNRVIQKDYPLKSKEEVEQFLINKIKKYIEYKDLDESAIPLCSDEELWRDAPVYKVYKDKESFSSGSRALKNFQDYKEALEFSESRKTPAYIHTFISEPKRCKYCPGFAICKQRKSMIPD